MCQFNSQIDMKFSYTNAVKIVFKSIKEMTYLTSTNSFVDILRMVAIH